MKNLFLGLVTTFALLAFAGCYDNGTNEGTSTTQKAAKCGASKCGDAKKTEEKAQCGAGKCGDSK